MMSEARKLKKHAVETSRVAHRGTLTQAGILILLAGFVMYQSMFGGVAQPAMQTVVPFKYYMLAVSIIVAGMNVGSIFATLRGRQPLAYSLSYLSMFVFMLGVITLIQGRALFSTFFLLVAAALGLRWICPPHHKRLYFVATAIVLAIAWWIEWYNPAWRVVYSGAQVGPIAAIVFALIFSVFLAGQYPVETGNWVYSHRIGFCDHPRIGNVPQRPKPDAGGYSPAPAEHGQHCGASTGCRDARSHYESWG
jgi:hypothetical protein